MKKTAKNSGVGLVIALSFIVLLTVLIVAYLSAMRIERRSTQNYNLSNQAEQMARGAGEEVKDDLLREIQAGSRQEAVFTQNGKRVYVPLSTLGSQPARWGFTDADYYNSITGSLVGKLTPSLLRVSRATGGYGRAFPSVADVNGDGVDDYAAADMPPNRASAASTSKPSQNSLRITSERWNKPKLLGDSVPTVFADHPPDWIYVTRGGSAAFANSDVAALKSAKDPDNQTQLMGRYAYTVYDEGGLLNVNAAGFPSSIDNSTSVRRKSAIAYADLSSLPGMSAFDTALDELINWRSKGSVGSGSFVDAVEGSGGFIKTGFLKQRSGDSPLLSRQDLIGYFEEKNLPKSALAFLGTFSRAVNAPSWRPTQVAPNVNYAAAAENTTAENRDLANVRASVTDGSPMLKRRFPLSRVLSVTNSAKSGPGNKIYDHFGLSRSDPTASWIYNHGNSAAILTLEEVKVLGREPDFFELLKTVILDGSLGRDPGPALSPSAVVMGTQSNLNGTGPCGQYFGAQGSMQGGFKLWKQRGERQSGDSKRNFFGRKEDVGESFSKILK